MPEPAIRDAATVILLRDRGGPEVLMGQRGARAVFMPSKFVFPGGAVDPGDAAVPLAGLPDPVCMERLGEGVDPALPASLVAAAVRETWEETGLVLGRPGLWPDPPADWQGFAATGHVPSGAGLRFFFRAITPPGRPRRFDARFFLADADALLHEADDFSRASDELSALQWIPLSEARRFDLPFITEVVLAELAAMLRRGVQPGPVPFFYNDAEASLFRRLGGRALL
ncbi:NUDIX hydrolase [Poseidonocella sp. HB161398]|uniref:NUDIX hydrolase n=1 Tax=Poseidonocella sp. HB161398 TaxID=2320855 RepID=UPI0011093638|nr:NUDIX hydrolase [Poseidonocella sp. HB161398]